MQNKNKLNSSKTEIEQNILQEINDEYRMENQQLFSQGNSAHEDKEYRQSTFNSNNTVKYDFDCS